MRNSQTLPRRSSSIAFPIVAVAAAMICAPLVPASADPLAPPKIVPASQAPGAVTGAIATATSAPFVRPAPAPGFDAMTATLEQLTYYGFPPRPDALKDPTALGFWKKMIAASKTRITPALQQTSIFHGPPKDLSVARTRPNIFAPTGAAADKLGQLAGIVGKPPPTANVNATSSNWSGFVDYDASGPFAANSSYILAEWIVPTAQQAFGACTGGWDLSSQWPGLDGFNSSDVFQAGTESDAYCLNGARSQYYALWYEWYPNAATRITNFVVSPGDLIEAYIWYTTSAPYGNVYVANLTTQQSTYVGFGPPAGTTFAGASAEWIVEAPSVSGALANLTNYTVSSWNLSIAYSGKSGRYYIPTYGPGATAYSIAMTAGGVTISSCGYSAPYAMWCVPSGPAL